MPVWHSARVPKHPCKFHRGCFQPCPMEAALLREIRETWVPSPHATNAKKAAGSQNGQRRAKRVFVPKRKARLTLVRTSITKSYPFDGYSKKQGV